jgi:hypothetical protein
MHLARRNVFVYICLSAIQASATRHVPKRITIPKSMWNILQALSYVWNTIIGLFTTKSSNMPDIEKQLQAMQVTSRDSPEIQKGNLPFLVFFLVFATHQV